MPNNLASPDHNPSFIRGLFRGQMDTDLVLFPVIPADEAENLRLILDSLASFAADHVNSSAMDKSGRFPETTRTALHELGLMGLNIPEENGGFGATAKTFTRIFGEMGAIDPALTVYFGAHQSIGCKGITLFGTPEQKAQWLPRCASGQCVAAFCLTEPGSGSDAQAMTTMAIPDGGDYLLTGRKIWISNAGYAGLFTVFAKVPVTDDSGETRPRVTAFIVDATSAGISLGALEHKMGIRASDTRTVTFESVRVPAANILGSVGAGFKIALEILNSGRLGLAAGSCHGTRRIMDLALAYAKERTQFGAPIASFEMIQKKLATVAADLYAAESAVTITAHMMDRGGIDYSLEAACCKVFASELANRAASEAMQIAGGIGYSAEAPYEQAIRDTRINMIFEGTNEILRALIALSSIQSLSPEMRAIQASASTSIPALLTLARRHMKSPRLDSLHPSLTPYARRLESDVMRFGRTVTRLLLTHGRDITARQFLQERMSDISIQLYLSTATLRRATWEMTTPQSSMPSDHHLAYASLFLDRSHAAISDLTRLLTQNNDTAMSKVASIALAAGTIAPRDPTDQ